MKLLAVDPGNTTGWCLLDSNKRPPVTAIGESKGFENFFKELEGFKDREVDQVVIEMYITNIKKFDHSWDKGVTSQIIGAVKYWAFQRAVPIKEQPNNIKPIGYGYLGIPNKHKHVEDAIVHGIYYIVKNKLIHPGDIHGSRSK